jgi:hypothetical protein
MRAEAGQRPPVGTHTSKHELDNLVMQLKELVEARARLERRGASPAEVKSQTAKIDRVRARLATFVQQAGDGNMAAA